MGYTKSVRSIKRVEDFLDQMLNSNTNLEWVFEDPGAAHWRIRDGIRAANQTDDPNYIKYRGLGSKYIIRLKPTGVMAELRDAPLKLQMATMVFNEINDVLGIIGAAVEHKAPKLSFPHANTDDADMDILRNFCDSNSYDISSTNPITLTKKNEG